MSRWTTLRRLARPLVFRARHGWRAIDRRLRPPRPWDGRHAPVLLRFPPWAGDADGEHVHDFLGVRTAARFRPQFRADPAGPMRTDYPPPHAGYFELLFVLEAVAAAAPSGSLTVMELGAGYGPWMVTAHRAMKRLDPAADVRLIGVEMVPHHVEWMRAHFRANGIDPAEHTVIQAATSDRAGEGHYVPETDLGWDFGQRLSTSAPPADATGIAPVAVRTVTLSDLLADVDRVGLLHIDIQGQEARVLRHAMDAVDRKVDRLIVATHSRRIHRELRRLFAGRGWTQVHDFGVRSRARTEFGDVQFLDGLLAWTRD